MKQANYCKYKKLGKEFEKAMQNRYLANAQEISKQMDELINA